MADTNTNIKIYLTNNGKTYDDEKFNYQIDGDSLVKWNVTGLAEPSVKELSDLEDEADTLEAEEEIIRNRRVEYPPWRDQLDMIYHDLEGWRTSIKTVKDKYPKG